MSRIAEFAGLDPRFYDHYAFVNVNAARRPRFAPLRRGYRGLKQFLRSTLPEGSRARRAAVAVNRAVEWRVLYKVFTRRIEKPEPRAETMAFLREFYREDVAALAAVLGQPVPWADRYRDEAGEKGA